MKKKIHTFLRIGLPVMVGLLLLSYGNTKNHPSINSFIVEAFVKKNNGNSLFLSKFKNYRFDFEKPKLKGDYITEAGLFNPSELDNWKGDQLSNFELIGINSTYKEEPREVSPKTWFEHGGFSADVPEVPASLRHFYDPTRKEGERYLTDKVNSKIMSLFQSQFENPKTDGLHWALGTKGNFGVLEHNYTWEHGKKYFKAALEETNPDKRKNFMAKAWRSLGETLHMIADHGCPPHVRNDGHPSIPIPLMSYFGNPDPYEELLDGISLDPFKNGSAPKAETELFRKAKTTSDIAHQLAVFTNKNFFSNETISGIDTKARTVKPVTHPEYTYPAPKINSTDYENGYYYHEIEGQNVLMCTDLWFFSKFNIPKGYPYIDEKCVHSQAQVLIPTITEAGVNVMKLFIPELKVTITSLDENGNISGTITHKTDQEYKDQIFYNGPVEIKNSGTKKLTTLTASKGKFSGNVDSPDTNIFAEIECGGVSVRSEIRKKPEKAAAPAQPRSDKMKLSVTIYVYTIYDRGFKDEEITFSKSNYNAFEAWGDWHEFIVDRAPKFKGNNKYGEIEGEMNDNEIVWLKIKWNDKARTWEEWWNAELINIPLDPNDVGKDHTYGKKYYIEGWDFDNEKPNPQFEKCLKKLEHEIVFLPSKQKSTLQGIDFTKSQVRTHEQLMTFSGMQQPRPFIRVGVSYNVY